MVLERKILRKISVGAVKVDQIWRRQTNQELKDLYKEPDVQFVRLSRLRWAGHVALMAENDLPRKIVTEVLHRTRHRGRPRLRWSDGVSGDVRTMMGVRNWMAAAQDRNDWWWLVQETRTQHRVIVPN
ncbi:uncharacterized protein [Halyomorpha halys]|uniref:uncharacterized protein n=1 Tax=Halyomorpha halys TaxID=286706 RepID=UPI0006D4FCB9|nr:uncharacterized protein LOC106682031 [Halyomorpha halys]